MKVLGIGASPREGGNTDTLIERALEGARREGAEGEVVFLRDLELGFCQGCGECTLGGRCVQMDGMQELYRKLDEAERIILGTPVYMNNLSAQMKTFADRCGALMEIEEKETGPPKVRSRLRPGKRALLIAVCACPTSDGAMATLEHLRELCKWLGIEVAGEVIGVGLSQVGDAQRKTPLMKEAFEAGARLIGETT
jgi:multimeric flavodoxin WrbA